MLSTLKDDLSNLYQGEKYLWLRFWLFGHLDLIDITKPDQNAIDLLNSLEDRGGITPTNVKLLFDIAEISQLKNAVDLVIQYSKDYGENNVHYQQLSSYRIKLFKALKQVDHQAFKKIISFYKLKDFKFSNIWDVVLRLEIDEELADTSDKIKRFAERLGNRAKNILLDRGAIVPATIKSETDLDLLNGPLKSIVKHDTLSPSIPASVKCVGLGINDPKASLCFHLSTNDRAALRELAIMGLDNTIIMGLADVLLPIDRQQFLDDWQIDINLNQVKETLEELKNKDDPSSNTEQESKQLVLTLQKKSSSVQDSQRPHALELLFKLTGKQNEWSTTDVDDVHKVMKALTAYFEERHIQFQKVKTGSIVLHLVSYDSEALEELWEMYCNKTLQKGLAPILITDEYQKEQKLVEIKIHEHDYMNALRKLEVFELLVPAQIYSKGKYAIEIYKDELKNGKIAVVNSRCMFLGKEGTGKTSCVKAMVRERLDSQELATDGIVTTTVFQARGKDSSKWKKMKDVDDVELSKKTRAHALAENVSKKLEKENNDTSMFAKFAKLMHKRVTIRKVDVSDITSIWDYAGQLEYYITHRFFLTNTVSYCVAFNVLDNLDEPAYPRNSIDSLGITNLDMNLFWIRSIYEHTVSRLGPGNPIFIGGQNIESPPISLVATHMDRLPGTKSEKCLQAEKMFMQMFDSMKGMPYAEHVDHEMYMVDNTVKSHEGIEKLKLNVARYMKEMVREVPIRWVDLQERLQVIGKTNLCITLNRVCEIGTECGISKDVLTHAITYLNDTGIIMYSNSNEKLRNIVITNIHWMIQIVTKVITVVTPTITAKQMWMLWEKFNTEGVLEEKLLRYLWQNEDEGLFDVFVELMKVFRLLFEKTKGIEEGNRIFLVPCRMKVDKEGKSLDVSKDDEQTVSIYLTPTDFLPDAVYHTLVVAFLEFMTEKGSDDSEVFRNRSDFKFSDHTVSLGSVKISNKKEKPYALKLEIARWTEHSAEGGEIKCKPEPSVCMEVLSYLRKQLETTCTIYEGIGYNLRVLCTVCEPSNHHLIDLDKCLKNKLVPCGRKKAMNTAHIKRFFFIGSVSDSELGSVTESQADSVKDSEPESGENSEPESEADSEAESVALSMVFGESPEKKFQTMLVQVSNWYDGQDGSLDMLKVLCKDLITPYNDLQKADTTMELFNLLKRAGHLTSTNFKVLIDIINVTGTKGALGANKYLKNAFDESYHHVTTVTTYRQKLIDFGKILSQDNVRMLINLNDVSRKQRDNQWTVILDLEHRAILGEDKLQSFVKHLKENKMTVAAEMLEDPI